MEVRRCMKCMHPLAAGETVCPECGRAYGSANAETFALKPGTILEGKYLVGEMLGQGGFGITYIGFDLLLEQKGRHQGILSHEHRHGQPGGTLHRGVEQRHDGKNRHSERL